MSFVIGHAVTVLLLLILWLPGNLFASQTAWLVELDGGIGPASQDLVLRSLEKARESEARVFIIKMNTPGGLDFSMRKMIAGILDSSVPIVTWVAPAGARAASAGVYILYASHVAAMAPTTHLGAATPVRIGAIPDLPDPTKQNNKNDQAGHGDAMERKIVNDAVAYIRGLAERQGRNAAWAEKAVREAVTLTAREALEANVIDLLASDVDDLLMKLDGRKIVSGHVDTVLHTGDMTIQRVRPDWRNRLLSIITDPNVAYILMLVGVYGLIFEFSSPGYVLPGVVGAISLLLALYAFQVLPVSYAGLALLAVGLTFIIAEAFVTSGGVLGVGGLIAFVMGSVILFDDEHLAVSLPLIGGLALIAGGFLLWAISRLAALRRRRAVSGREAMIGKTARVIADFSGKGWVRFEGESWRAESAEPLTEGQKVQVVESNGLVLKVRSCEEC